jgi:hypothetical protein
VHRWPAWQVWKAQDWTQSPARQNVPAGQVTAPHGSAAQAPERQSWPVGQPVE